MLPDGARERLLAVVNSARDRLVVTWLEAGGLRIGELCGLHLVDLHLRENAACGECRTPHVHVCHRPGNPNRAEAKTKHPWRLEAGTVTGGLTSGSAPRWCTPTSSTSPAASIRADGPGTDCSSSSCTA
jgi:hypothetical protein